MAAWGNEAGAYQDARILSTTRQASSGQRGRLCHRGIQRAIECASRGLYLLAGRLALCNCN
jgi:hypothetical protein